MRKKSKIFAALNSLSPKLAHSYTPASCSYVGRDTVGDTHTHMRLGFRSGHEARTEAWRHPGTTARLQQRPVLEPRRMPGQIALGMKSSCEDALLCIRWTWTAGILVEDAGNTQADRCRSSRGNAEVAETCGRSTTRSRRRGNNLLRCGRT